MSEQQQGFPTEGRIAGGFGFVTPEDRARWEQARQYSKPRRSAAKEMVVSSMSAASELGQQGIQAKLRAAYQVEAQEEMEQTRQTKRQVITEVVDYEDRDDRDTLEPGFEF